MAQRDCTFIMRMTAGELAALEAWRKANGLGTRAGAARELMRRGGVNQVGTTEKAKGSRT